eukprot:12543355-Ditylum_brightwellii.AAC.1
MAIMRAQGVPIAVPMNCFHHVFPKLNTLDFITSFNASMINLVGKSLGILSLCSLSHASMASRRWSRSMLVYITVVSVVNILAPPGRTPSFFRSALMSAESLIKLGRNILNLWRWKSSQVKTAARSDPVQLTTGGVL